MKTHYDQVRRLESIDLDVLDDFDIVFENTQVDFPMAYVYPNQEPPLIRIIGNRPSLIRYAITSLLLHEYVEYLFHVINPDFEGDSHDDPEFQEMEREALKRILKAIEAQEN